LIFMAAALVYVPIPDLFGQIMNLMARFIPGEAMQMIAPIVKSVLRPPGNGLLSFGIIGTLWVGSSGFSSLIDALNIAYDVPETRPYWKTRSLAVGLTLIVGGLVAIGLAGTLLGPNFAVRLSHHVHLSALFIHLWPVLRWVIIFGSIVLAVELLYYLGPNVKQRFLFTLPGALIGVVAWVIISLGFGIYVRRFANYNATYGTLGGVIALMFWFYLSSIAILVGGEINAELIKAAGKKLKIKCPDPVAEAKAAEKLKAVEAVEHKYEGKERRRTAAETAAQKYSGIDRRHATAA
jgi:membrane protein